MSKIEDLIAAQARVEQQIKDMAETFKEMHSEQRVQCQKHSDWTASLQRKVEGHEAIKERAVGAMKVAAWAASSTGIIGSIIAMFRRHKGGQ